MTKVTGLVNSDILKVLGYHGTFVVVASKDILRAVKWLSSCLWRLSSSHSRHYNFKDWVSPDSKSWYDWKKVTAI